MERHSITDRATVSRRTAIGGALVALSPLVFPSGVWAGGKLAHNHSLVLLLQGLYQPVTDAPSFPLTTVDLSDGSYSTTKIYPVSGTLGIQRRNQPIGDFYAQFNGDLCAYHIRGGSFAMQFTGSDVEFVDDGQGGRFLVGAFELTVLEATGIYRSFAGGHNHMVDKLHFLPPGDGSGGIDEYCFCFVSRP